MGNFYCSTFLPRTGSADVASLLSQAGCDCYLAAIPQKGTVVYAQADETMEELPGALSERLQCVAWTVMNSDDDILVYWLHDCGELVDRYGSSNDFDDEVSGDPSGGDAARLAGALGRPEAAMEIERILHEPHDVEGPYLFEINRHAALAAAAGLPIDLLALDYSSIEAGETNDQPPSIFQRIQ